MFTKQHYIKFGPHAIHRKYGNEHFQIVGATGSGKTLLTKALVGSILACDLHVRACVYDAKSELLPTMYRLAGDDEERVKSGKARVKVLNPFDQRACAWDLSKDIDCPVAARQLSTILVPESGHQHEGDGFFDSAVRDILTALQLAFMNCVPNREAWTFRDLILAAMYENYTRFVFDHADRSDSMSLPIISRVRDAYLDCDPRTANNIRATISTRLSIFEPIAACWEAARRKDKTVSLTDWASDGCRDILVLGNDETSRASFDAVNRALFKRISELVIGRRESSKTERESGANQSWFWLDEIREAGHLDGLSSLLTKGRSKGACVVLAFQDIEGLRDVYGESVANELTGQCNNAAFLRIVSPSTAKVAVESFGTSLKAARGNGISFGQEGASHSHNTNEEERPLLYSSDFLYMPPAGKDNGVSGYYRLAGFCPVSRQQAFGNFMPDELKKTKTRESESPESPWLASFYPRPLIDQYLLPWDRTDWERLGLEGEPPSWRKSPRAEEPTVSELMQEYLDGDPRRP